MKLKIKILSLAFLLLPFTLSAQVSIQFSSVNEYMFSTKEALNLIVINSGAKAVQVQFSGKITREGVGEVTTFKSDPIVLNIGSNVISPLRLAIQEINYVNPDIGEIEQRTGTYPSGNYTLCIWSACTSPDCDGSGPRAGSAEQPVCTNIQVENPTPLLLSYPSNDSEIEENRPTYTWIPPAPIALSDGLNYTMTLVEIFEGQSKSDALALNRPLIEWAGIQNPMLMHPSDLPELEAGKSYAWQVQAYVGGTFFAKSEQWKFKVRKEMVKKDTVRYAVINRIMDAGEYQLSEGFIYFTYKDRKPNYALNCSVLNSSYRKVASVVEQVQYDTLLAKELYATQFEKFSDGKYRINIDALKLAPGYYYIEVVTSYREKLYLKFKVD